MEGTDKYLVAENYLETAHGKLGCINCHGGENVASKEQAHTGLVKLPSADDGGICVQCHSEIGDTYASSTHYSVQGMRDALEDFSHPGVLDEEGGLQEAFNGNCYNCHSTCGSCHVSRPVAYSGGLHSEHLFTTPPMEDTCYGCHGSRTAGEFMGKVGYTKDVHFEAGMTCLDCHPVSNFHGTGDAEENLLPNCTDCHPDVYSADSSTEAHRVHDPDLMSCQVCHSSTNNNCFDCHVEVHDGGKVEGVAESKIMLKIGLNPNPTPERPYKYTTLRHIPTVADTFAVLNGDLPNYDGRPNWKYSPTHNVQRSTIQNESCDACHGNQYIFLREEDLLDNDSKANQSVVVKEIPK